MQLLFIYLFPLKYFVIGIRYAYTPPLIFTSIIKIKLIILARQKKVIDKN